MLVQHRASGLRLVRQHDHALLSGALAHAWAAGGAEGDLPLALVLAVSLHDLAWLPLDREPRLDPSSGLPHDFTSHPAAEKLEAYARGLDRLEAIHPVAGLLGSLHYGAFAASGSSEADPEADAAVSRFLEGEKARRGQLEGRGAGELGGLGVEDALELLRFFDRLSLLLCLAAPGSDPVAVPGWLRPAGRIRSPDGTVLRLTWKDEGHLALAPFPLRHPLPAGVPFRDLPAGPFRDQDELLDAWELASRGRWELTLSPG